MLTKRLGVQQASSTAGDDAPEADEPVKGQGCHKNGYSFSVAFFTTFSATEGFFFLRKENVL